LFFNRSHFVNISGQGAAGTSTITLAGPSGTVFTQTLARSTEGGTNGSGIMQALLRPGRYSFTIQSQIDVTASFPPSATGSGQTESRCFLQLTPCQTEIALHVAKGPSQSAVLSWTTPPAAGSFDVGRGDVRSLLASGG